MKVMLGFPPSLVLSNIIHNLIFYSNQIYWIEFLHPGVGLRPSMMIPYGTIVGADTIHPEYYQILRSIRLFMLVLSRKGKMPSLSNPQTQAIWIGSKGNQPKRHKYKEVLLKKTHQFPRTETKRTQMMKQVTCMRISCSQQKRVAS